MQESINNIIAVHRDDHLAKHLAFQKNLHNLNITVGDFVKTEFVEGDSTEHMWLSVTNVADPENITGTLANDPFVVSNYKFGDVVTVKRTMLSEYLKQ